MRLTCGYCPQTGGIGLNAKQASPCQRNRAPEHGFTFIEVVFAILLLAVSSAFATTIFIRTLQSRENAYRQTTAALIVREAADRIAATPSDPAAAPATLAVEKGNRTYQLRVVRDAATATLAVTWTREKGEGRVEVTSAIGERSVRR